MREKYSFEKFQQQIGLFLAFSLTPFTILTSLWSNELFFLQASNRGFSEVLSPASGLNLVALELVINRGKLIMLTILLIVSFTKQVFLRMVYALDNLRLS